MEIEFENTRNDYKKFYRLYFINKLQKFIALFIIVPFLLKGVSIMGEPLNWSNYLIMTLGAEILLLLVIFIIPYFRFIIEIKKIKSKENGLFEKEKVSILDEGINYGTSSKNGTWNWESISSIQLIGQFIYLVFVDKRFVLIPIKAFSSISDKTNFIGIIQSRIIKGGLSSSYSKPTPMISTNKKRSYLFGFLCLIPFIGIVVGLILFISGISKHKDKWLILIGIFGIIFSILFSSLVFYTIKQVSKNDFSKLSQIQLDRLVQNVEFYKLQNGQYPDSLQQLLKSDEFAPINDCISSGEKGESTYYNYINKGDKYLLFSSGVDGIPNTADDLYPKISITYISKVGFVRKRQ